MDLKTNPQQSTGSFINKDKLAEVVDASRKAPPPPAQEPKKSIDPLATALEDLAKKEDEDKQAKFLKMKTACETDLGIVLTDADLRALIFKRTLSKELVIFPGIFHGFFKVLQPSVAEEIDHKLALFLEGKKHTVEGASNEKAKLFLSYAWISGVEIIDGVAQTPRSLGDNYEARRKTIDDMAIDVVRAAADTWNNFSTLIELCLQEKRILKKS